jgi:hypothetical protein
MMLFCTLTRTGNDDEYGGGDGPTTPLDEHAFDIAFVMCINRGWVENSLAFSQIRHEPHK